MRSCGWHNVRKHREIKNSEHYIALEIYFKLNFMVKGEVKSSGSRDYVGIYGKWLTTPTTIRTKSPTNKQKGRTTMSPAVEAAPSVSIPYGIVNPPGSVSCGGNHPRLCTEDQHQLDNSFKEKSGHPRPCLFHAQYS